MIGSLMPATGLGDGNPRRPYVTGGLGAAVYLVYISEIEPGKLTCKWYMGDPSSSWSLLLGTQTFDYDGPQIFGVFGPIETIPYQAGAPRQITGLDQFMTFDDTVDTFVSTPDVNQLGADTANIYQSMGFWDTDSHRATSELISDPDGFGGKIGRFTITEDNPAYVRWRPYGTLGLKYVPAVFGQTLGFGIRMRGTTGRDVTLVYHYYDSLGVRIGQGVIDSANYYWTMNDDWIDIVGEISSAGATTAYVSIELHLNDRGWLTGDYLDIDRSFVYATASPTDAFIPSNRINGKLRLEGKFRLKEYSKGVSYQRIIQRYGAAPSSGWLSYFDYNLPDAYQSIGTYDGNVHHLRNGPRPGAPVVRFEDGETYETAVWVDPRTGDWGMERPLGNEYFTDNTGDTWEVDYVSTDLLVGLETDGDVFWWKVYDDDLLVQEFNAGDLQQTLGPVQDGTQWTDAWGRVWTATGSVELGSQGKEGEAFYGTIIESPAFNALSVPFGVSTFINVAQTVTLPATEITGLEVSLRVNAGAPTEDVHLDLYTWDGVSDPDSGTLVATVTIPSSEITGTFQSLRGNTSVHVDAGQYAIVYRSATSDTDYYATESNGFGSYSDGSEWRNLFGTWGEQSTRDLAFTVWGQTGTAVTGVGVESSVTSDWSVMVGDQLWTFSSAMILTEVKDTTLKWGVKDVQASWSFANQQVKWSVGEAF